MNRFLSPFLATVVLLAACRAQSTPPPAPTTKSEPSQWSGQQGGTTSASTRIARTTGDWDEVWRQIGREPPRPLDAAREIAVAVFLGERRTGGYRVEMGGGEIQDGNFVVTYREITPAPDAMVTQALTSPWAVSIFPRPDLPVTVRKLEPASRRQK